MTLNDISYDILETIRAGSIVDDERIDVRHIDELVKKYRAEYVTEINRVSNIIPENYITNYVGSISVVDKRAKLITSDIIEGRFGPMISEVYSNHFDEYAFSYVNRSHFRYAGNSRFNYGIIFYTYKNGVLEFKNKNGNHLFLNGSSVSVDAIFESPEDAIPNFDRHTTEYPIDYDGASYIKEKILAKDIRFLINQEATDETSDASGEIKQ